MGCYATALPGGVSLTPETAADWSARVGLRRARDRPAAPRPRCSTPRPTASSTCCSRAGGNWMEVLPDPGWVRVRARARRRCACTSTSCSRRRCSSGGGDVLLLPAASRYEIAGRRAPRRRTERRIIFSPEIPGSARAAARAGSGRSSASIAARVRPELRDAVRFATTQAVRDEIGAHVPLYAGIETPAREGRPVPVRRPRGSARAACSRSRTGARGSVAGDAAAPASRHATASAPARHHPARQAVQLDGPRGRRRDHRRPARGRAARARGRGPVRPGRRRPHPRCATTTASWPAGCGCVELRAGNAQVHWPEGNVLLDRHARSPEAGVPDYNAWVTVERA